MSVSAMVSTVLTGPEAAPPKPKVGRRTYRLLLFAALICSASVSPFVAAAQNTVTVDTAVIGMTGWRSDPERTDDGRHGGDRHDRLAQRPSAPTRSTRR